MDFPAFIEALRQVPCTWTVKDGLLRTEWDGQEFCPITAVCYHQTQRRYRPGEFVYAGEAIGLEGDLDSAIVEGADHIGQVCDDPYCCDVALYRELLVACKVTAEPYTGSHDNV